MFSTIAKAAAEKKIRHFSSMALIWFQSSFRVFYSRMVTPPPRFVLLLLFYCALALMSGLGRLQVRRNIVKKPFTMLSWNESCWCGLLLGAQLCKQLSQGLMAIQHSQRGERPCTCARTSVCMCVGRAQNCQKAVIIVCFATGTERRKTFRVTWFVNMLMYYD